MVRVLRGIDYVRDGYAAIVRRLVRVALVSLALVALCGRGAYRLAKITPTSFLPEEDQGAFFNLVQLPDGASVARTSEAARRSRQLLKTMPQVQHAFSILGFSLLDAGPDPMRRSSWRS